MKCITTDGTQIDLSNLGKYRINGILYSGKPRTGQKIKFTPLLSGYNEDDKLLRHPIKVNLIGHLHYKKISRDVNTDNIITRKTRNKLGRDFTDIEKGSCLVFETQEKFPVMLFSSAIKSKGDLN